MVSASVDIGSNTIRLLIARKGPDGGIMPIRHERAITRLARNIESTGILDPEGAEHTIAALVSFRRMIREAGVSEDNIFAAGTSALRESGDGREFIDRIKSATGLQVSLISGEMEAAITAAGVLSAFPHVKDAFIMDIGGGSTESIAVAEGRVAGSLSLPVGVVKLVDRHLRTDPPSGENLDSLKRAVAEAASAISKALGPLLQKGAECIGTAGTPTTLAAIDMGLARYDREKASGYSLGLERLREIFSRLCAMSLMERRERVAGLESGREDLIIAGTALTIGVMEGLGFSRILVSDAGLLEGIWITGSQGGFR